MKDDPKKAMQKSIRRAGPWGLGAGPANLKEFGGLKRVGNLMLKSTIEAWTQLLQSWKRWRRWKSGGLEVLDFDE